MDKTTKLLRTKLNTLEQQCFNRNSDEDSSFAISDDSSLNTNFYQTMDYFKKNYHTAYNKTLIKLNILPLQKGIENLKKYKSYFQHKNMKGQTRPDVELDSRLIKHLKKHNNKLVLLDKTDGSLYELDTIDFFLVRIIINTLRMYLKLPLTKEEVYREMAIDMSYDAEPIQSRLMDEESGDISDQFDMDMSQDSCNMCLNQAVGDLRPKINFLKSISQSTDNWFLITDIKYDPNSDLEYDISVTTEFKPAKNIKDKVANTKVMRDFEYILKDVYVPPYATYSDVSDSDFDEEYSDNCDFDDSDFSDDYSNDSDYITPAPDLDDPEGLYDQIVHLYDIMMRIPYDEN